MTPQAQTATAPASPVSGTLLNDDMLARFARRAPQYDHDHRFAQEDFEELREAGYLLLNVPAELGGYGRTTRESCP